MTVNYESKIECYRINAVISRTYNSQQVDEEFHCVKWHIKALLIRVSIYVYLLYVRAPLIRYNRFEEFQCLVISNSFMCDADDPFPYTMHKKHIFISMYRR